MGGLKRGILRRGECKQMREKGRKITSLRSLEEIKVYGHEGVGIRRAEKGSGKTMHHVERNYPLIRVNFLHVPQLQLGHLANKFHLLS